MGRGGLDKEKISVFVHLSNTWAENCSSGLKHEIRSSKHETSTKSLGVNKTHFCQIATPSVCVPHDCRSLTNFSSANSFVASNLSAILTIWGKSPLLNLETSQGPLSVFECPWALSNTYAHVKRCETKEVRSFGCQLIEVKLRNQATQRNQLS